MHHTWVMHSRVALLVCSRMRFLVAASIHQLTDRMTNERFVIPLICTKRYPSFFAGGRYSSVWRHLNNPYPNRNQSSNKVDTSFPVHINSKIHFVSFTCFFRSIKHTISLLTIQSTCQTYQFLPLSKCLKFVAFILISSSLLPQLHMGNKMKTMLLKMISGIPDSIYKNTIAEAS